LGEVANMSRRRGQWTLAAVGSLALPVGAMIVWPDPWWPVALFAAWTAAAAWTVVVTDRLRERLRHARMLELVQRSAIETLSHHRHDWMNELQILYGYLRLNKPDKAIAVVDRIRSRMEHDSRISRLGVPKLAAFFLSFRTVCDTMKLEVEVDEGVSLQGAGPDADRLADAVIGLVNLYRLRAVAAGDEENVLLLRLRSEGASVVLEAKFGGQLAGRDSLERELERVLDGVGSVAASSDGRERGGSELTVVFPVPVRATDSSSFETE